MQSYLSNRSPYTVNIETYFGRLLSSLDNEELSGTKEVWIELVVRNSLIFCK